MKCDREEVIGLASSLTTNPLEPPGWLDGTRCHAASKLAACTSSAYGMYSSLSCRASINNKKNSLDPFVKQSLTAGTLYCSSGLRLWKAPPCSRLSARLRRLVASRAAICDCVDANIGATVSWWWNFHVSRPIVIGVCDKNFRMEFCRVHRDVTECIVMTPFVKSFMEGFWQQELTMKLFQEHHNMTLSRVSWWDIVIRIAIDQSGL